MVAPPPIEIANLGMADTLILMVLALVVFGPRRLPQIGRQIGKLMYEFRKASNDFKFQMEEELRQAEEADRRKKEEAERQRAQAAAQPVPQAAQAAESAANSAPISAEVSASSPASPMASPYPGESTYPDAAAGTTRPVDATAAAVEAARLRLEPGIAPRIQPPSTGERVAASRPGAASNAPESPNPTAEDEAYSNEAAANDNASGANDAANQADRSEPGAHHD
ncbi:MAG: twin-arginine translocase TatA/TatE family subunit [Terracidiphilus sp.]